MRSIKLNLLQFLRAARPGIFEKFKRIFILSGGKSTKIGAFVGQRFPMNNDHQPDGITSLMSHKNIIIQCRRMQLFTSIHALCKFDFTLKLNLKFPINLPES